MLSLLVVAQLIGRVLKACLGLVVFPSAWTPRALFADTFTALSLHPVAAD